jgi:hypothetical protein
LIDDVDLLRRPAEGDGPFAQRVLPPRAFGILVDLPQCRLANVEIGVAIEMVGSNSGSRMKSPLGQAQDDPCQRGWQRPAARRCGR